MFCKSLLEADEYQKGTRTCECTHTHTPKLRASDYNMLSSGDGFDSAFFTKKGKTPHIN